MSTDGDVIQFPTARLGEPADTQYDLELDPEPDGSPLPAEQPEAEAPRVELRPILPSWMGRGNFKPASEQFLGLTKHRAGYHGLRLPKYLLLGFAWGVATDGGVAAVGGGLL